MVIIQPPATATTTETSTFLRGRYGLTKTQARVAVAALTGISRAAIAADLGLTVNTVGTHLRGIYTKTGAHTHAELVGRILADIATT
jgi:DNA-binding CsgD family transcriptional regulator